MKLSAVEINDFRCFGRIVVPLHMDLTVLVGPNGAGKTAILDAIGIGLAPILQRLSSAGQRLQSEGIKDTDFRVVPDDPSRRAGVRPAIADYARVSLQTTEGVEWDYWRPSSQRPAKPPRTVGFRALEEYLVPLQDAVLGGESPMPLPVLAYYGPQRAFLRVPGHLHSSRTDFSQRVSALVGALDAKANFKECLQWFDAAEADELRMNRDCKNVEDFRPSSELRAVGHAIEEVFQNTVSNPRFTPRGHKLVVDYRKADGRTVELRVDQLSQGYQGMLALVMDFARRQALANPDYLDPSIDDRFLARMTGPHPWTAPGIMLIDEIELHLHPSWQQRVIPDLRRAFPNTQFIVTTHSPQVLTSVRRENIRLLTTDGQVITPDDGTYGAESSRVLEDVFGVHSRPPEYVFPSDTAQMDSKNPIGNLRKYLALVESGKASTPEAVELRASLEDAIGKHDPDLKLADIRASQIRVLGR